MNKVKASIAGRRPVKEGQLLRGEISGDLYICTMISPTGFYTIRLRDGVATKLSMHSSLLAPVPRGSVVTIEVEQ